MRRRQAHRHRCDNRTDHAFTAPHPCGMAPAYHTRAQRELKLTSAYDGFGSGPRKRAACGGRLARSGRRSFAKLFIGVVTTGATIVIGTLAARDTWLAQERGDTVTVMTPLHAATGAARRLLDDGDDSVSLLESATSVLVIATVLVAFGIVFDLGKEALFESTGRNVKPVLNSLFGELTLLGFIGLVMFLVERTKSLNGFSEHLFGEGDTLDDLVETVHMALFLISTCHQPVCHAPSGVSSPSHPVARACGGGGGSGAALRAKVLTQLLHVSQWSCSCWSRCCFSKSQSVCSESGITTRSRPCTARHALLLVRSRPPVSDTCAAAARTPRCAGFLAKLWTTT